MIRFDATGRRPVDKWITRKRELPTSPHTQQQQKRSIDLVHKPVNSVCYRQYPECGVTLTVLRISPIVLDIAEEEVREWRDS